MAEKPPRFIVLIVIGFILILAAGLIFLLYYTVRHAQLDEEGCIHGTFTAGECICDCEYTGSTCNETAFICAPGINEDDCNYGSCQGGLCICDLGWTGTYCNETADMCLSSNASGIVCFSAACCNDHGTCWFGKCICDDEWYGETCDLHSCLNITEYNNCTIDSDCKYGSTDTGDCYYNRCFCIPGYVGTNCQLERRDLSFCNTDTDCLNGGVCYDNSQGNGECYCPSTTTGYNCET